MTLTGGPPRTVDKPAPVVEVLFPEAHRRRRRRRLGWVAAALCIALVIWLVLVAVAHTSARSTPNRQERTVDERAKFHYYLARTYAKAGDVEHTLIYVRKALEEGFKEPDKFKKDPEFQIVQDNPEFKVILAAEHKVL